MLLTPEVRRIAVARLLDAKVLLKAKRYDGAVYLCGYAVELVLKARICKTLKWKGYPETKGEFDRLASFKVHDLDVLLRLTPRRSPEMIHVRSVRVAHPMRRTLARKP